MTKKEIIEKVTKLVEPVVTEFGYELWYVDYYKDPTAYNLLIEIDKDTGISIEDVAKVNSKVNELLDEVDIIKESYCLELASAGLERELKTEKHIKKFVGTEHKISVKLYAPVNGQKFFEGKLSDFDGNEIKLTTEIDEKIFALRDIALLKAELIITEDISK
ncbi:MAG: hypothetical protein A2Y17_03725 [Clostridiales bacterium GWF2_38_85]|nr:MAG: hypothetical protein A2Y17_03725 [Clostridiales bacterium GWF2_38_85]HBL85318.1 ribosome maturation factor RimP [Clostridiales bacterium]